MALGSVITDTASAPFAASQFEDRASAVENLLSFIESEYKKGNHTVTKEKYNTLQEIQKKQKLRTEKADTHPLTDTTTASPRLPRPLYPPLFTKYKIPKPLPATSATSTRQKQKKLTFKNIESAVIAILETLANLLDNLHLFSKLPMFPGALTNVLKHTNRLWVVILIFLIRKTVSQLLNVIRKEKKVRTELSILKSNSNSKLLEEEADDSSILKKYEKVIRDLTFDKMMLKIELVGNFLDLVFNVIELYNFPVPPWFMNSLNFASMAMTVYRMNKDDEYVDDDITDDLI